MMEVPTHAPEMQNQHEAPQDKEDVEQVNWANVPGPGNNGTEPILVDAANDIYWDPLGPGILCEVNTCKAPAYEVCNKQIKFISIPLSKECGRKMCVKHAELMFGEEVRITDKRGKRRRMVGKAKVQLVDWKCKDDTCRANLEAGNKTLVKIVVAIVAVVAIVVVLIVI